MHGKPSASVKTQQNKFHYFILARDEEFAKWNTLLIQPSVRLNPNVFSILEMQDEQLNTKYDFWNSGTQLLSFEDLEGYINNSEFILNPDESDKVVLFERIAQENSDFGELFKKYMGN